MYLTLAEVVASDADCLIRNCDFPAMQDNPIRLTMFPLSSPETQEEEIRWMTNGLRLALEKDKSHYRKACADDGSPVGFAGWSLLNSSDTRDDCGRRGQVVVDNPEPKTLDKEAFSILTKTLIREQHRILKGHSDIWCKIFLFHCHNLCLLIFRPNNRCCESSVSASRCWHYAPQMGM